MGILRDALAETEERESVARATPELGRDGSPLPVIWQSGHQATTSRIEPDGAVVRDLVVTYSHNRDGGTGAPWTVDLVGDLLGFLADDQIPCEAEINLSGCHAVVTWTEGGS